MDGIIPIPLEMSSRVRNGAVGRRSGMVRDSVQSMLTISRTTRPTGITAGEKDHIFVFYQFSESILIRQLFDRYR